MLKSDAISIEHFELTLFYLILEIIEAWVEIDVFKLAFGAEFGLYMFPMILKLL